VLINNSTDMNKAHVNTSCLISLNIKKTRHVKLEIKVLVWDMNKNVTGSNRLMKFIAAHWIVNIVQPCYVHDELGNQWFYFGIDKFSSYLGYSKLKSSTREPNIYPHPSFRNCIGGVVVGMLALRVVDREFKLWSG
jgi:hypothetical protein